MFFKGVVESHDDPLRLGRVRVRVLGVHTENKNEIPTEHLPWANPAGPITSAGVTGVGDWRVPVQGAWVWIFFEDYPENQRPVYFATVSGIPQVPANTNEGFNDPAGIFPLVDKLGEPDYNRLASNRKISQTVIQLKDDEQTKHIPVANLQIIGSDLSNFTKPSVAPYTYSEPIEPYATTYPNNRVIETEPKEYMNGHVIELDDTESAARIHIHHKAGTSISIHPNGQMITKIRKDNYNLIMGNSLTYVNGTDSETVWGDKRIVIKKNVQREVYGSERQYIKGNEIQYISGDFGLWIGSELVIDPIDPTRIGVARKIDGSDTITYEPTSPTVTQIGGNFNMLIENGKHFRIKANEHKTVDGTFYMKVSGTRTVSKNLVGVPGSITFEPMQEFLVKGHAMTRLWANSQTEDGGVVNSLSICPMLMSQHMSYSFDVKCSI